MMVVWRPATLADLERDVRQARKALRDAWKPLDPVELARGLNPYAKGSEAYRYRGSKKSRMQGAVYAGPCAADLEDELYTRLADYCATGAYALVFDPLTREQACAIVTLRNAALDAVARLNDVSRGLEPAGMVSDMVDESPDGGLPERAEYVTVSEAASRLGLPRPTVAAFLMRHAVDAPRPNPQVQGANVYDWAEFKAWWRASH